MKKFILLFLILISINISVNAAARFQSIGYIGQSYGLESPAIIFAGPKIGIGAELGNPDLAAFLMGGFAVNMFGIVELHAELGCRIKFLTLDLSASTWNIIRIDEPDFFGSTINFSLGIQIPFKKKQKIWIRVGTTLKFYHDIPISAYSPAVKGPAELGLNFEIRILNFKIFQRQ